MERRMGNGQREILVERERKSRHISPCMHILKLTQTNMPNWQGSATACHRSSTSTRCCEENPSSSSQGVRREWHPPPMTSQQMIGLVLTNSHK